MGNLKSSKKFKSTFEKITWARQTLELPESATMQKIKESFKKLITKWHPDKCHDKEETCREKAEAIILANEILNDYCAQYQFSFSKEEVKKYCSKEEWWLDKFGEDPVWGKGNTE